MVLASISNRKPASLLRRQIDRHVDVIQIKNRQNALARGDHFAGAGEPILHASAPRRDQHEIDQNRLQPFDVSLGGLDRGLRLITLGVSRNISSVGRFEPVAPLIDDLLRDIPFLQQSLSALIIGPGECQIAVALRDERNRFRQRLLGFQHLGLRGAQLGFGFRRRDGGDHLSGRDLIALVNGQRRQPTRVFRRHIHLRRFDATVGFHDALGHVAATQVIYQRFDRLLGFFDRLWRLRLGMGPDNQKAVVRDAQCRCDH